jgi:hypothetical protein
MAVAMKPKLGIYKNIDFDTYASWDAANSHLLGIISKKTPAHAFYEMQHGGAEPTEAMDFGRLVHLAILEPERFDADVAVPPKVDRRTKAGKTAWAQFQASHPEAELVGEDTYEKIVAMRNSAFSHSSARELLSGPGVREVCLVWEEQGVLCKARLDLITAMGTLGVVVDLKTAKSAVARVFEKDIGNFWYHGQASHYLSAVDTLLPQQESNLRRPFIFIVLEKEPPYLCNVVELDDSALEEGNRSRLHALARYKECKESGVWPGYGDGIETVSLKPWEFKNMMPEEI